MEFRFVMSRVVRSWLFGLKHLKKLRPLGPIFEAMTDKIFVIEYLKKLTFTMKKKLFNISMHAWKTFKWTRSSCAFPWNWMTNEWPILIFTCFRILKPSWDDSRWTWQGKWTQFFWKLTTVTSITVAVIKYNINVDNNQFLWFHFFIVLEVLNGVYCPLISTAADTMYLKAQKNHSLCCGIKRRIQL